MNAVPRLVTVLGGVLALLMAVFPASAARAAAVQQGEPQPLSGPVAAAAIAGGRAIATVDLPRALHQLDERLRAYPHDFEASLLKGLLYFKAGNLDDALAELDTLTRREPKFRLAHLIRGDLLLARIDAVTDIGNTPLLQGMDAQQQAELHSLRDEARVRLRAYLEHLDGRWVPRQLLALGQSVDRAIVVDKTNHRLYVFDNSGPDGVPRLERDFYVSTGKLVGNKSLAGDLRTPEGVYFVTGYLSDAQLPDKYGDGAFPVNYPNEYDQHLGKTGGGIWLHGTEHSYYSRPPQDSEGCVVLANFDLEALKKDITPGVTPVVITDNVDWVDRDAWQAEREQLFAALDAWRRDWQSNDVNLYLSHYAPDFWSAHYDYEHWAQYKRRVAAGKTFQQVDFSDISLFAYPRDASGKRPMVVATFHQQYRSNNFNSDIRKRVYLAREGGVWRILYEGP